MRRIGVFFALACAAGGVPGCGWKMVDAPIRVRGQVIDADTKAPVEGAYIDIADDREKLDIRLHTAVRTDSNGAFDTTFVYAYERWAWLGIPVWWLSTAPERIYVCLLYTSDAADDLLCVDLGGRRIIKKKTNI